VYAWCECGVNALHNISPPVQNVERPSRDKPKVGPGCRGRAAWVDVDGQLKVSLVRCYEWASESAFGARVWQVAVKSMNCRVLNDKNFNWCNNRWSKKLPY